MRAVVNKYVVPGAVLTTLMIGATWDALSSRDPAPVAQTVATESPSSPGTHSFPSGHTPSLSGTTTLALTCSSVRESPFRTTQAKVAVVGSNIEVQWSWAGTPPTGETFGLYVMVATPDKTDIHQLGYKVVDGQQAALFDADLAPMQQHNFDIQVVPQANGITLSYPGAAAPFPNGLTGAASVTVDGNDVMACA